MSSMVRLLLISLLSTCGLTAQWPQFRGPDGNGIANLMEYALGAAAPPSSPVVLPAARFTAGRLALRFDRLADPALTYTVEAGDTPAALLPIWSSTGAENTAGPVTIDDLPEAVGRPKRFLRLRVSQAGN